MFLLVSFKPIYAFAKIPSFFPELKIGNMDMSLISAGDDIKIWDSTNFVQVKQFNPHDRNINSVCLSNDSILFEMIGTKI